MIAILNFTSLPLTDAQHKQIVASIVEQSDKRFIIEYPRSRVYEIPPRATAQATLDAVPLTPAEWRTLPVIPFIQPSPISDDLQQRTATRGRTMLRRAPGRRVGEAEGARG